MMEQTGNKLMPKTGVEGWGNRDDQTFVEKTLQYLKNFPMSSFSSFTISPKHHSWEQILETWIIEEIKDMHMCSSSCLLFQVNCIFSYKDIFKLLNAIWLS